MSTNWLEYFAQEMNKRGISDLERSLDDKSKIEGIPITGAFEDQVSDASGHVFYSEEASKRIKNPNLLIWCNRSLFGSNPKKELQESFSLGFETDIKYGFTNLYAEIFGDNVLIRNFDEGLERPSFFETNISDSKKKKDKEKNPRLKEEKPVSAKKFIDEAIDIYCKIKFYLDEKEALKKGNPFDFHEDIDDNWDNLEEPSFFDHAKSALVLNRYQELVPKTIQAIKCIEKANKKELKEAGKRIAVENLMEESRYTLEQIEEMRRDAELVNIVLEEKSCKPKDLAEEISSVKENLSEIPRKSIRLSDYDNLGVGSYASYLRRLAKHTWDIQKEKK